MAEDLQYNTPQDRLLVMLLERVSALEDTQQKLLETLAHIWEKSSSVYFCIVIEGKRETPTYSIAGVEHYPFGIRYEYLSTEKINTVKKTIKDTFECIVSIEKESRYGPTVSTVSLYLEFNKPMLLDTLTKSNYSDMFTYIVGQLFPNRK